jgi:hypothetical protein
VHFLLHTDQPRDLILAVLFDDINTGMGVAAGTNQDRAGFFHEAPRAKLGLLGIMAQHRDSDAASARSVRE